MDVEMKIKLKFAWRDGERLMDLHDPQIQDLSN